MALRSKVSAPPTLILDAWQALVHGEVLKAESMLLSWLQDNKMPSLTETLMNESLSDRFMAFLEHEHCAEQLVFILAINELRSFGEASSSSDTSAYSFTSAKDIITAFFDPCELNLSHCEKDQVLQSVDKLPATASPKEQVAVFDTAYHSILSMLVEPHKRFANDIIAQIQSERRVATSTRDTGVNRLGVFKRRPPTRQASQLSLTSATDTANIAGGGAAAASPLVWAAAIPKAASYQEVDEGQEIASTFVNVPLLYRRR
jgi:hypothetical protein